MRYRGSTRYGNEGDYVTHLGIGLVQTCDDYHISSRQSRQHAFTSNYHWVQPRKLRNDSKQEDYQEDR